MSATWLFYAPLESGEGWFDINQQPGASSLLVWIIGPRQFRCEKAETIQFVGDRVMNTRNHIAKHLIAASAAAFALIWNASAAAHCDTLDGPVVAAARKALDTGNVNLVLIWVQKRDEAEIRNHFQKTLAVRKVSAPAKELADMYFFETLVRLHRAGEGAGYTGLKPAGKIEPPIAAADKSLETGKLQDVAKLISQRMEEGLHRHFEDLMKKKKYNPNDVTAGRAFASAYVEYTHFVERLYDAAETLAPEHVQKKARGLAHSH